jgi:glycosyltransferase involved in cell wall biosynthesis
MKTYSLVDAYVSPSMFYLKLLEKGGVSKDKLFYIPNFIHVQDFSPQYGSEEDYIVYFGRLSNEKGILTLIDAISKLSKIKLAIIGHGPILDSVKSKIKDLGLEARVQLLGFKSGIELYNIIKKSRFIVIPSEWYENNPYSVLEAMALGKPIIGSEIGGIPELVQEDVNGYLFKYGDSEDLAEKINKLYYDDEKLKKMGMESRRLVETKYTDEVYYNEIMKVYDKCLGGRDL